MFLSEHFLKPGVNEIIVLELHDAPQTPEIAGTVNMISTEPVPFAIRLDSASAGGGTRQGRRGSTDAGTPGGTRRFGGPGTRGSRGTPSSPSTGNRVAPLTPREP